MRAVTVWSSVEGVVPILAELPSFPWFGTALDLVCGEMTR